MMNLQVYQNAIFELLAKRKPGATICPSEAARLACSPGTDWRNAMPDVRSVATDLVAQGRLQITQGGQIVDIHRAKGAIRLRLPSDPSA